MSRPASDENPLSEYEQLRLSNIARNKSVMQDLGLQGATTRAATTPRSKSKKAGAAKRSERHGASDGASEPSRRSKRVRGSDPDYTRERIDRFGEELDRLAEGRVSGARGRWGASYGGGGDGGGNDTPFPQRENKEMMADLAAVAAEARAELEAAKARVGAAALAGASGAGNGLDAAPGAAWRSEAVARWGPRVLDACPPDWEAFVSSRLPLRAPPSPLGLLQVRRSHTTHDLARPCVKA